MSNLDLFTRKHLDLIELEKSAEIDESKTLLSSCSLQRLQLKGLCLLKLKIDHKYTGLYGRTIIVFDSAVPNKQINTQHFSSGDIVSITENSIPPSQLNNEKDYPTGTITKVTNTQISVAIDNDFELLDDNLNEANTYKLIKLCNDVTHKRIKNALTNLKDLKLNQRASHLADVLFLNVKPESNSTSNIPDILFFNKRLDDSQQEAVKFTFEQKDVAIIHGPPGTGKTTTLIEIIKQNCLKFKQKILIVAPSNIAVDNLVERLIPSEQNYSKIKMIRLGHPARLLESIQEYSLDSILSRSEQYKLANDIKSDMDKTFKAFKKNANQRGERESLRREMKELRKELYQREEKAIKYVLESADCILATLTTTHTDGPLKHLKDDHFDIIIIDECSQAMEAACWIPLIKGARKLIIAGDHLQLPPTIISKEAAQKGLDLTLMKRLIDALGDQCTKMLTIQYRMNKLINNWISDKLYDSKLKAAESVAEHLLCDLPNIEKNENTSVALVLIDTDGCDMNEMIIKNDDKYGGSDEESKANEGEANLVCRHVQDLINSNLKQETIAVITPYNLQMELIKAKLHSKYPNVEVKSVDGFQGREKEAIVLSLVRSNKKGEVGFLADQRRINVAITRARRHLCVVCDTQTCKSNDFLKSFLDYCEKYADVRSAFDYDNSSNVINDLGMNAEIDFDFEDIKFQKLQVSKNTNEPKKSNHKNISKQKEAIRANKNDTKVTDDKVKIETEEDKQFEKETIDIIEKLIKAGKGSHKFSSKLNSRQRRIVHELSEQYRINHESKGTDEERYISIWVSEKEGEEQTESLSIDQTTKFEQKSEIEKEPIENKSNNFQLLEVENTSISQKKNKKDKNKKESHQIQALVKKEEKLLNLLGEINDQNDSDLKYRNDCRQCPTCTKFILKANYLMHELHCVKINKTMITDDKDKLDIAIGGGGGSVSSKSSKSEKKQKIKDNPISKAKTDDFDELLEMFQESNNVCSFKGCKVLVKTLGQNCEFCRNRFCLKHSLAEFHGCGDEAKKQARAHIRKTGNLNVNEKQSSYSQELKHKYAEKKLHEKIEAMKAERTGANKKKEKN